MHTFNDRVLRCSKPGVVVRRALLGKLPLHFLLLLFISEKVARPGGFVLTLVNDNLYLFTGVLLTPRIIPARKESRLPRCRRLGLLTFFPGRR